MSDEVSGGSGEPAEAQSAQAESAQAQSANTEPARTGPANTGDGPEPRRGGLGRAILDEIVQGSPAVTTTLAFIAALVIGALVIAFSNPTVLHYWNSFFAAPGTALSTTWDSIAAAYSAMFEGAIFNPHTIAAAANGTGSIGAIFYPLSETAAQ